MASRVLNNGSTLENQLDRLSLANNSGQDGQRLSTVNNNKQHTQLGQPKVRLYYYSILLPLYKLTRILFSCLQSPILHHPTFNPNQTTN